MNIKKTITIGAKTQHPFTIKRLGYGTMRLTGSQIWGEPKNRDEALQILKSTVENGIHFLDTADYYGQDITNKLIAEALYPYENDLIICTKVGAKRGADKSWNAYDKPENLRASIENNLKTLKIDQVQLVHFRVMPESNTPIEESLNAMYEMQKEGKILHVGVSNVTEEELKIALSMGEVASVENAFGYEMRDAHRGLQEVIEVCTEEEIPMIPFFSLQSSLPNNRSKIAAIAEKYNATSAQVNLAWLLHYNDLILPIPGTSQLSHFKENIKGFDLELTEEDMIFLG